MGSPLGVISEYSTDQDRLVVPLIDDTELWNLVHSWKRISVRVRTTALSMVYLQPN